jgi:hypothetical protein
MKEFNGRSVSVRAACAAFVIAGLLASGCVRRPAAPTASPIGEQAPVTLRSLEIKAVDGHRAVLLRLSRLPTLVRHSTSRNPGRITIEAWGPVGAGDLPERILPQDDPEIAQVRVSRRQGGLRVVFDLHSSQPPPHAVHEMADWIMVRFTESRS